MAKRDKNEITIPINLAKLLAAGPDDHKNIETYEQSQETAKALLRVLLEVQGN